MVIVVISMLTSLLVACNFLPANIGQFYITHEVLTFANLGALFLMLVLQWQAMGILKQKSQQKKRQLLYEEETTKTIETNKLLTKLRNDLKTQKQKLLVSEENLNQQKLVDVEQLKAYKSLKKEAETLKKTLKIQKDTSSQQKKVMAFLSLLQEKGRFLDFIMDDLSSHPNEDIGAAARVVHQGCLQVMNNYFEIKPVCNKEEGTLVEVDETSATDAYETEKGSLLAAPFKGRLIHKGWYATKINLPELTSKDPKVIVPATVES